MATLGGLRSEDQTRQFLRRNLEHWDRHGDGLWVFRDNEGGRFVGRGGQRHVPVGSADKVELAYALTAKFWGRGLATEMAEAIATVRFEHLGMEEVVCFTLPTNLASRRVMEKVGFTFEREVIHANLPHVLYRIAGSGKVALSRIGGRIAAAEGAGRRRADRGPAASRPAPPPHRLTAHTLDPDSCYNAAPRHPGLAHGGTPRADIVDEPHGASGDSTPDLTHDQFHRKDSRWCPMVTALSQN
jgi:[ribosomal protein S5]-alanine N-acetyltransferase